MSLATGIIGLPNVGKSTLFNAITKANVLAENYPFATIEPNEGIIELKDPRLIALANLINPDKLTFATAKFVDIAGLVKGASQGLGLGNKFLNHIRNVDAICHVVRCFQNDNIVHYENKVDAISDLETINLELIIADLAQMENRLQKINKKSKSDPKLLAIEHNLCQKIINCLSNNFLVSSLAKDLSETEKKLVKNYGLLTYKPTFYVANLNEKDLKNPFANQEYAKLADKVGKDNIVCLDASLELELAGLEGTELQEFLTQTELNQTALTTLVSKAYEKLGLATFFTFGKKEVRAWQFNQGMNAQECAGIIHSDFAKGFIKAEIMHYQDLLTLTSENAVKKAGKMKVVGKDYVMQDGDVCLFRFNV